MNSIQLIDHFRPIMILFTAVLALILVMLIFQKSSKKVVNDFTVIILCGVCTIASAHLLFLNGIFADELNSAGDPVTFYLFFAILGLSCLNFVVYLGKKTRLG